MAEIKVKLTNNVFKVSVVLRKPGSNVRKPLTVNAIIDTGASSTCICGSYIQALGLQPDGPYDLGGTANGNVFSRKFPLMVQLEGRVGRILPCVALFQPTLIWQENRASKGDIPIPELTDKLKSIGVSLPSIFAQKNQMANGTFVVSVIGPGAPINQQDMLVGMDMLSQFEWRFDKLSQELIITI